MRQDSPLKPRLPVAAEKIKRGRRGRCKHCMKHFVLPTPVIRDFQLPDLGSARSPVGVDLDRGRDISNKEHYD